MSQKREEIGVGATTSSQEELGDHDNVSPQSPLSLAEPTKWPQLVLVWLTLCNLFEIRKSCMQQKYSLCVCKQHEASV